MAEPNSKRVRVERLLAQDPEINAQKVKEFRMQLEESLEAWETNAKRVRRGILITAAIYLTGMFVPPLLIGSQATHYTTFVFVKGLIAWAVIIAGLASFAIGAYLIGLYFFKYAPGLRRARFDLQAAMMRELQQQVEQLRQEIERRDK